MCATKKFNLFMRRTKPVQYDCRNERKYDEKMEKESLKKIKMSIIICKCVSCSGSTRVCIRLRKRVGKVYRNWYRKVNSQVHNNKLANECLLSNNPWAVRQRSAVVKVLRHCPRGAAPMSLHLSRHHPPPPHPQSVFHISLYTAKLLL